MKITFFLLLLFLPFLLLANDETGSIRGYVEDKQNGQRLTESIVILKLGKKEISRIQVNESGDFIFANLAAGIYDVVCEVSGYVSQRIVGLDVKDDRIKLAYFSLRLGETDKFGVELVYTYAALQAKLEADVTTVSRTEESAANAPASVYVVTQEEIAERGYNTLAELLEDIPGVEINERADGESYNYLTIRGVFGNNKLVVLVDGVRFSAFSSERMSMDKNFNIRYARRVELLIGPASAVYGADAFTGVVNIITEDGKYLQGGKISGSYGMYNTTQNNFVAGAQLGDVQMTMGGSFYHSDEPNLAKAYPTDFAWYNDYYSQNGAVLVSPFAPGLTDTLEIKPFSMRRWAYSVNAKMSYKGL